VFPGDNGQGETNLLEAIFAVAALRSFRTSKLADLISARAGAARADATGNSLRRCGPGDADLVDSAAWIPEREAMGAWGWHQRWYCAAVTRCACS
jgi:hypothetical protein